MIRISIMLIFICLLVMASCFSEEQHTFTKNELQRILAGDTIKFWHLTRQNINGQDNPLEGCNKSRYLALAYGKKDFNKRYFASFILSGSEDCNPQNNDIIDMEEGAWFLMADPNYSHTYDTLVLTHGSMNEYKAIKIITPWDMELEEFRIDTLILNRDTSYQELRIHEVYEAVLLQE